jgi:hypothetical protein
MTLLLGTFGVRVIALCCACILLVQTCIKFFIFEVVEESKTYKMQGLCDTYSFRVHCLMLVIITNRKIFHDFTNIKCSSYTWLSCRKTQFYIIFSKDLFNSIISDCLEITDKNSLFVYMSAFFLLITCLWHVFVGTIEPFYLYAHEV